MRGGRCHWSVARSAAYNCGAAEYLPRAASVPGASLPFSLDQDLEP
jgi:hypothetical protein